jgi:prepilin-type N-terminal cleavage/methylation domain-containing protein
MALPRTTHSQRGFSLVEMMFAIGIAGVAAFALLALLRHNADMQLRTEQRSLAVIIAERALEEARRTPFLELNDDFLLEAPFYRGLSQGAEVEIRLFDEAGDEIFGGPDPDAFSFVRVQATVTLNAVNPDGTPRSNRRNVTRETLVTWVVPPS